MKEVWLELDWSPLWISLKTGFVATLLSFFLGIGAAWLVMHLHKRGKWFLDGLFTMPLVLPPTVAGFLLLMLFSVRRPFGSFLYQQFDIKIIQSWAGCVIAATVIAFPLMYRNARAAFEQVDMQMIYAARTLGLSEGRLFVKNVLPLAGPGIASGTVLTFARAMGEYGATAMLAGNILGKTRTIAVAIAAETAAGNYDRAAVWVIVILVLAFVIIFGWNAVSEGRMKNIRKW